MRRTLSAALLALAALSGCVVHKHYSAPPPPPPAVTVVPSHVHTEYCVMYTDLYGCSHDDIIWLEARGCDWDDMGILFYLWWGCGRRYAIHEVHRWHYTERVSWHVCFTRARVDPYGMFVHVDYTPSGPCGRAYGYYHRREPVNRFQFHDDDLRAVFRVNVAVNYYKQPPRQAFERVRDRQSFQVVVREEHARQNHPRWENTPQGQREREDRDRGRAANPPPGQDRDDRGRTPPGQDRDERDRGRGPDANPPSGQDRDDRGRTPPGQDRGRGTGPTPPSGQDRGRDSGAQPPPSRGGQPDREQPRGGGSSGGRSQGDSDRGRSQGQGQGNADRDDNPRDPGPDRDSGGGRGQGSGGGKKK